MPNGEVWEFPSDMSDAQISAAIQKSYDPQSGMGASKQAAEAPQETLMDKVMRYGLKDPAAGATKLVRNVEDTVPWIGNKLADLPPTVINAISRAFGGEDVAKYVGAKAEKPAFPSTGVKDEQIYQMFGLPPANKQNAGDVVAQFVPDLVGAIAMPETKLPYITKLLSKASGKAGKVLPRTAETVASQAAYGAAAAPEGEKGKSATIQGLLTAPFAGASQYAKATTSPQMRNLMAMLLGTAGGGAGWELGQATGGNPYISMLLSLGGGALGYRSAATPEMKMLEQVEGVNLNDPAVQEKLAASNRIGVNITPAEAAESPYLGGVHAQSSKSAQGSKVGFQKGKQRIAQEESAVTRLMDNIYDPAEMDAEIQRGYAIADQQEVPPTMPLQYQDEPIVEIAFNKIEDSPELLHDAKKKGLVTEDGKLDRTKLGSWDNVKRYLDEKITKIEKGEEKSTIDIMKYQSLKEFRDAIRGQLENISEDYRYAKGLAERRNARETVNKAFNKADIDNGNALFKKLQSRKDFAELMGHLNDVPEAQQALRDMRLIFKNSRPPAKINTTAGLESTNMNKSRNLLDAAKERMKGWVHNNRFDERVLDFIHSGRWQEEMVEINKISDQQKKMAAFVDLLGKAAGTAGREAAEE